MKIKVKEIISGSKFNYIDKGDWIDLRLAEDVELCAPQSSTLKTETIDGRRVSHRDVKFDYKCLRLGIAMKLPAGYEALILPRSSTFKNVGIISVNSQGVIDNSYSGNKDEWKFPVIAFEHKKVLKGTRICQFRIQLSQRATLLQKLKWLFTRKIEFIWVDELDNSNRGGFGSTGID